MGKAIDGSITLSHILFADDTLIFCNVDHKRIQVLRVVLLCFEVELGLKMNLGKSKMVTVEELWNIICLANLLGCKFASLPWKYLRLLLGASFIAKTIWDGVVEKIERRLVGWKRLYLSKGGRIIFIKNTLSNLSTYYLSLYPLPIGVANLIEQLFRSFFWGGLGEESGIYLFN